MHRSTYNSFVSKFTAINEKKEHNILTAEIKFAYSFDEYLDESDHKLANV